MKKDTLFYIDNMELVIEKVLVEDDAPVLFVCADSYSHRYLVLCVDDYSTYIVAKISIVTLKHMLESDITMRDAIKCGIKIWRIVTADDPRRDDVAEIEFSQIDDGELPVVDSFYDIPSQSITQYRNNIRAEVERGNVIKTIHSPTNHVVVKNSDIIAAPCTPDSCLSLTYSSKLIVYSSKKVFTSKHTERFTQSGLKPFFTASAHGVVCHG